MKITAPNRTTGIGSLPHHNSDAALDFSFRLGIPFLPQIPIRNPWEYMLPQALEALPGIQLEADGSASINLNIWNSRAHAFGLKLENSFKETNLPEAFESFEPSASSSSLWQPFLFELEEREIKLAKIQIAGPITCQWALRSTEGNPIWQNADVTAQIYRCVLARALSMSRRLQQNGIQPLIFIDEPALYALSPSDPNHLLRVQELKILIQALRRDGAWVGLHCCSNAHWSTVLSLELDVLSIDAALSLESLVSAKNPHGNLTQNFLKQGGTLSLGVIPTTRSSVLQSLQPEMIFSEILSAFHGWEPSLVKKTLNEAIYTPACGLALHTTGDAELVLDLLIEYERFSQSALK